MGMNNRLLVPRASGINPKSIAGLSAWWDFSDSSQITLNGSTISQIIDKSGSGRTASQSTAAAQPTLTTNAQNGKSMATFNNSSTRLTYDTDLFTFTGAATIFVVCSDIVVALQDYAAFVSEYRGTGTSVLVAPALYQVGGTNRGFRPGLDGWSTQTLDTSSNYGSPTQTSPSVVQFYWENWSTHRTNGTTLIGVNNDSVSLTSRGGTVSTFSTSASKREIGSASGPSIFDAASVLNGRIGEILVYTAALSSSQRSNVRKYLGSKWGIAVT